jgi:predicted enzyme related to lactoylglutathione lyase
MVTRDTAWLPGTPCWVDLSVDSVEQASAFYAGLFGWKVDVNPDPEFGGHGNFTLDGKDVAGVSPKMDAAQPTFWATYLASDDVDATAGKITAAGGQIIAPAMDIGEFGRMIVAADPAGAMFGVWQAGQHIGFSRANEPGSVSWNENMSRDFEGNKKFYTEVFGYEYGDMSADGFSYATLDLGDKQVGGIGGMTDDMPAEMPSSWTVYFAVEDTDVSVAKLAELGGAVVREPWDSPYGRMAIVTDDQGAAFAIITVTNPAE